MSEKGKEGAGSGNTHYHIDGGTFHVYMPAPGPPQPGNPNFGQASAVMAGPPPTFTYVPAGSHSTMPPPAPEPPGYITLPKGFPPRMLTASSLPPPEGSQKGSTSLQHLVPAAPPGSPGQSSTGPGQVAAQGNVWDKYYYREYQYAPVGPPVVAPPLAVPPVVAPSVVGPPVAVPPPGLVPIVGPPPPLPTAEPAQPPPYHSCAECGRIRSSRYHRDNPIIPGRPPLHGVCRRCQRKSDEEASKETHYIKKVTHISSCEAPQPCVPLEDGSYVRVIRDDEDRRGRRLTREPSVSSEEVEYVTRVHSSSRHRSLHRIPSRTHIGVRILQERSPSPPPAPKYTYVEYDRSPSPRRTVTRFTKVVHRVVSESPPRQRRYETPPPRVRYRYESPSYQHERDEYYGPSAAERIAAHPSPYGYHVVQGGEHHPYEHSPGDSSPHGLRSILKKSADDYKESAHRRAMSQRRSAESTMVELGDSRVHFGPDMARRRSVSEHRRRGPEADVSRWEEHHSPPRSGFRYTPGRSDYESVETRWPDPTTRQASAPSNHYPQGLVSEDGTMSETTDGAKEEVQLRTYRGIDEDGRPATFVEERRTRFYPTKNEEGQEEHKYVPGSWRDV